MKRALPGPAAALGADRKGRGEAGEPILVTASGEPAADSQEAR